MMRYDRHWWRVNDHGGIEIYGGLEHIPTEFPVATSGRIAQVWHNAAGHMLHVSDGEDIWLLSSGVAETTPEDRGPAEALAQREMKLALREGHLPLALKVLVLDAIGIENWDHGGRERLEKAVGAPCEVYYGTHPWSEARAAEAVPYNAEKIRDMAGQFDAIAGDVPAVALEALCATCRAAPLRGPAGMPFRVYAIATRACDGKRRWARVW